MTRWPAPGTGTRLVAHPLARPARAGGRRRRPAAAAAPCRRATARCRRRARSRRPGLAAASLARSRGRDVAHLQRGPGWEAKEPVARWRGRAARSTTPAGSGGRRRARGGRRGRRRRAASRRSSASTPKRRICETSLTTTDPANPASTASARWRSLPTVSTAAGGGTSSRAERRGEHDVVGPGGTLADLVHRADGQLVSAKVDGEAGQALATEPVAVALHDRHDAGVRRPGRAEVREPGGAVDVQGDGHDER